MPFATFISPSALRYSSFSSYRATLKCSTPFMQTTRCNSYRPATTGNSENVRNISSTTIKASLDLPKDPVIGFIGLGVMGLPMLHNLSKEYSNLIVWNRTDKTQNIKDLNISTDIASNPSDVIRQSDVTFSMLSTPAAVQSVFFDGDSPALSEVTNNKCIVDCSTLEIKDMQKSYEYVKERNGYFLEAPVSGSKIPAEQGQLIFLCGGDQVLFDHEVTQSAFDLMGKRSFYLGDIGNGTKMKLVVNQLMATMLAALGESIVLTESTGLSVDNLLEVISLGAMTNPMFALKGPKMAHGSKAYDTNFPLTHAQKDVAFAQNLGDQHGINMSVSSAANTWYKNAKEQGLGRDDFCAVIESIRASTSKQ